MKRLSKLPVHFLVGESVSCTSCNSYKDAVKGTKAAYIFNRISYLNVLSLCLLNISPGIKSLFSPSSEAKPCHEKYIFIMVVVKARFKRQT